MTILNGVPNAIRHREIRVGQPNAIGKSLIEFFHQGKVLHSDRFDIFAVDEADKGIKKYLAIAGQTADKTTVDSLRVEIQRLSQVSEPSKTFKPQSFSEIESAHSRLRPVVVDGVLRVGETLNVIAPPKTGKSFLSGGLAWCVATGRSWLSHEVHQGRVLIVDNELHVETLVYRLGRIADAMEIPHDEREGIDIISIRGQLASIVEIAAMVEAEAGKYRLIVVDALYRTLPKGTSENDNAGMMAVYNHIDALAERTGSAVVVVHHSSKGDQSGKGITDIGAGAGSISRAADSHLAIRPHEENGHFVLEAVTRSFKSPEPVSIKFEYPIWTATTLTPEVKKPCRVDQQAQKQEDAKAKQAILDAIPDKGVKQAELIRLTGFGCNRLGRLIQQLRSEGSVLESKKRKRGGKQSYVVFTKPVPEAVPETVPD